jgi:hypothetical protein
MNWSTNSTQPYQAVIVDPSTGLATVKTVVWTSEAQAREWVSSLANNCRVELWYNEKMIGSCLPPLAPGPCGPA